MDLSSPEVSAAPTPTNVVKDEGTVKPNKSNDKSLLYGIIITLILIVIGLGIFAFYKVKESENAQSPMPQVLQVEDNSRVEENYNRTPRENQTNESQTYSSTSSTNNLLQGYVKDEDGYTNVRKGPGTNYEIVTRILDGTPVFYTVVPNSNWYLVYDERGNTLGYMYSNKIVPSNRSQKSNENNNNYIDSEDADLHGHNWGNGQVLHHQFSGVMTDDNGTNWPIQFDFDLQATDANQQYGKVYNVIYTNVSLGGKIRMTGDLTDGLLTFRGKDGSYDFVVCIDVYSHRGTAVDGPVELPVWITPLCHR